MKKENKKVTKTDKKEIIITAVVLALALVLGIFLGKELFDSFQARM